MSETFRDPLTGVHARTNLETQLRFHIDLARTQRGNCSILFIDLDHFKSINDGFGHARGDAVLIETARRIQGTSRPRDMLFRYGGDEFVLVLPGAGKESASKIASRLLQTISGEPFNGDPPISLAASIGVATFPEDAYDPSSLLKAADQRVYEAKRHGRDRFVAGDLLPVPKTFSPEETRLVEREQALETTHAFLNTVSENQLGVLILHGSKGAGISRFLTEVEQQAQLFGFATLSIKTSPRLKDKPYAALVNTFSALSKLIYVRLTDLLPLLYQHLAASGKARLLICIDEIDHLDRGSLDLLRQLVSSRRIPTLGIAYSAGVADRNRLLVPEELTHLIHIQPLSMHGLRIWLRMLLHWEPPDNFLKWLYQQTSGLPGQVIPTLAYLIAEKKLVNQLNTWRFSPAFLHNLAPNLTARFQEPTPNNLPKSRTSFVNREDQLKDIRQLFTRSRLISLIGAGGIGKTRLALEAGRDLLETFPDGVWLIELAATQHGDYLLHTIAETLGVQQESGRALKDTLVDWFGRKELLLILDNCEHLVGPAALFTDHLLQTCSELHILATSREALNVQGEVIFRVPALDTCPPAHTPSLDQLMDYSAIHLLMERAVLSRHKFQATPENAPLIAEICHRLDGLPLAIELAAARLRELDISEIASQLDQRLHNLKQENVGIQPRQQTLHALIEWSYTLLSEEERTLFRRLAVFNGGWKEPSALAVCSSKWLPSDDIPFLLRKLADKSLIQTDPAAASGSYSMLETIRQFAMQKLHESGEYEQVIQRHTQHFLEQARFWNHQHFAQKLKTIEALEQDHGNYRAALEWAIAHDPGAAQQLSAELRWFWSFGDHTGEAMAWYERILPLSSDPPHYPYARLGAGLTFALAGQFADALDHLHASLEHFKTGVLPGELCESVALAGYALIQLGRSADACQLYSQHSHLIEEHGTPEICTLALSYWGRALINSGGSNAGANILMSKAIELGEYTRDPYSLAVALMNKGYALTQQGDYAGALEHHQAALHWRKSFGTRRLLAISSLNIADVYCLQTAYTQARPFYEEALQLQRSVGLQLEEARTLQRLGLLHTHLGDLATACDLVLKSLRINASRNALTGICECISAYAELLLQRGDAPQAAQLLGFLEPHAGNLRPIEHIEYHQRSARVRASIPAAEFEQAWSAGQTYATQQLLKLILDSPCI